MGIFRKLLKVIVAFVALLIVIGVISAIAGSHGKTKAAAPVNSTLVQGSSAPQSTAIAAATTAAPTTTTLAGPGTAFSLTDSEGEHVDVELFRVVDPAQPGNAFEGAPSGERLVAVEVGIGNMAASTYSDDMNLAFTVVGTDDQTYTAAFSSVSECTNFDGGDVALAKGATSSGCVVFTLPDTVAPAEVQYKPSDDFGGAPVTWRA